MTNRILMHAGTLCYATYLLHVIVLYVAFALILESSPKIDSGFTAFLVAACMVITFALAQISWLYLERPCIRFGQKFRY